MTSAIIAGGGPGGLYTAWRLLTDENSPVNNVTILEMSPDRVGGRIHTQTFTNKDYVDLGGMRYSDEQRIIGQVIIDIGYSQDNTAPFVEATDRLLYLRGEHIYSNEISAGNPVPYNTPYNNVIVDEVFDALSGAVVGDSPPKNRADWCTWIETATIPKDFPTDVYKQGDVVSDIGYWNLLFDYVDSEAFQYCADAGGYWSNVINWNAADAIQYNSEFGATVQYKRFRGGYTTFIDALHDAVTAANNSNDPVMLDQRVVSFDFESKSSSVVVTCNNTSSSDYPSTQYEADYLFLCMPRQSVELIAQSAYDNTLASQLNNSQVKLYVESVIEQPSFKIGLSCDRNWWEDCDYKPKLDNPSNAWGPTITDLPLRQIYYFTPEDAALDDNYGVLASYDDMQYTSFWQELELSAKSEKTVPESENYESLGNGTELTDEMKNMVATQLAQVHYNSSNQDTGRETILESITEGYYMDWSLNPFGGGYHAWAAHYKICDVMNKIRKPLAIIDSDTPAGADQVFLIGSAYSNDQAWVEGAFCTSESVLTEYFNLKPIVNTDTYPLICSCS